MISRQNRFVAAASLALLGLVPESASAQEPDRRPRMVFSIAESGAGNRTDGPLFRRAEAAFAAARESDAAYARFLAPNAEARLSAFAGGEMRESPFTAATIRAASESCLGPYAYDEGSTWVQLSWVCRVDGVGSLPNFLVFRHSPELSLTVWFEDALISRIVAMEPLMIPGARRVAMEAYGVMQGR